MSKATNKIKSLDEYKQLAAEFVREELYGMDPDEMRRRIRERLNQKSLEITMSALGFENGWGRWEVSRRDNKNLVAEALLSKSRAVVEEWLAEQASNLPTLTKQAVQELHKRYLADLKDNIARELRNRAATDARRFVDDLLQEEAA